MPLLRHIDKLLEFGILNCIASNLKLVVTNTGESGNFPKHMKFRIGGHDFVFQYNF